MKSVYIIVPVYNVEKYLSKCLDSIFSQTYSNLKVICVNDGSTDNSLEILNRYLKENSNMILINKSNGGLSSARNAGLDSIVDKNSYIMFIDSDDWICKDYVQRMVELIENHRADIVCSDYFDVNGYEFEELDKSAEILNKFDDFKAVSSLFSGQIQSHGPCKLYRTNLWGNVRYDETIFFLEDQSTVFKTFLKSKSVLHTSFKGYYYFHRLGSICQSKMTNKKILSALRSYNYVFNFPFEFSEEKNKILRQQSYALFLNAFLMLYPRYNFKEQTNNQVEEMNKYIDVVKTNRQLARKIQFNRKTKAKYIVYKISKSLYKLIYSKFLKGYDK